MSLLFRGWLGSVLASTSMAERMPRRSSEVSSKRFLLKLYCRPARLNIPSSVNALSDFCLDPGVLAGRSIATAPLWAPTHAQCSRAKVAIVGETLIPLRIRLRQGGPLLTH